MLNRLAGAERSIVSDMPGTTRDAVDTLVQRGQRSYRFVDTAGIRRKGKTKLVAEKLSVIMARRHLEQADVAVLIVDASLGVTAGDANIASCAEQSGRSVIIVMNKWDLALEAAAGKNPSGNWQARQTEAARRGSPQPQTYFRGAQESGNRKSESRAADRGLRNNRAHEI